MKVDNVMFVSEIIKILLFFKLLELKSITQEKEIDFQLVLRCKKVSILLF